MARTNFFGQHSVDIWSSRNVNLGTGYTLKFNYANSRNIQGNGRGKVAQPTENDIQLIYFQYSEIMSAIKMLVVRRNGLGMLEMEGRECSIIWLVALEKRLQCGMKLTQDTGHHHRCTCGWLGGCVWEWFGGEPKKAEEWPWWLFIFALTATNTTMK